MKLNVAGPPSYTVPRIGNPCSWLGGVRFFAALSQLHAGYESLKSGHCLSDRV